MLDYEVVQLMILSLLDTFYYMMVILALYGNNFLIVESDTLNIVKIKHYFQKMLVVKDPSQPKYSLDIDFAYRRKGFSLKELSCKSD